jgi:hypothetical protein
MAESFLGSSEVSEICGYFVVKSSHALLRCRNPISIFFLNHGIISKLVEIEYAT